MVFLFSNRKSRLEKEIIEILTACGADYISDKTVTDTGGFFTVAGCYKNTELNIKKGVVLILDDTHRFEKQYIPDRIIGVCEDTNTSALKIFKKNGVPVITCGNNSKNTLTISSIDGNDFVVTLQRELMDINGNLVCPADYKMSLKKKYSPQAVMLSCAILCLVGAFI